MAGASLDGRLGRTGHLAVSVPPCRAASKTLGSIVLPVKSDVHHALTGLWTQGSGRRHGGQPPREPRV